MKVLLIGMDGASKNTFERGWTPYISQLLTDGKDLGLRTDLYSRGWLEIATGKHSSKTTAVYDGPKCNGSLEWSEQFKINDIPGLGESVKPIWQQLNEKGYRVGVMNLPTTFPAPAVDGFFVSGGGGGGPVVDKPVPELCFPKSIVNDLLEEEYIVDERVTQLVVEKKLSSSNEIYKRLANKNDKRTNSFIRLSKKFQVDFGFIVYKTSSVLAESLVQVDWHKYLNGDNTADKELLLAIENYYKKFDLEIEKLHKAFPSAMLIFVADHGMIRRTHSVNPNRFLVSRGFQVENIVNNSVVTVFNSLKRLLPFRLKKFLKKRSGINRLATNSVSFDSSKTQAFCRTFGDWRYGIYINDEKRFGGPVKVEDIAGIAMRIVNKFNSYLSVSEHAITVKINDFTEARNNQSPSWLPDIFIDVPDGYLITDKTQEIIEDYNAPRDTSGFGAVLRGEMTSIKSTKPLTACYGNDLSEVGLSCTQLVDIYQIIDSAFD
jgi:predicted AlkP superfamily phosphohydrolase/phosphomutase